MIYCTPWDGFFFGLFEALGALVILGAVAAYAYWVFKDYGSGAPDSGVRLTIS